MDYDRYKLVRDKIPGVIEADVNNRGQSEKCERVLDITVYKHLLGEKLKEETAELLDALAHGGLDSIENELADVHEVLVAIADCYRCRDVVDLASEKAHKLGGFYQGFVLDVSPGVDRLQN